MAIPPYIKWVQSCTMRECNISSSAFARTAAEKSITREGGKLSEMKNYSHSDICIAGHFFSTVTSEIDFVFAPIHPSSACMLGTIAKRRFFVQKMFLYVSHESKFITAMSVFTQGNGGKNSYPQ